MEKFERNYYIFFARPEVISRKLKRNIFFLILLIQAVARGQSTSPYVKKTISKDDQSPYSIVVFKHKIPQTCINAYRWINDSSAVVPFNYQIDINNIARTMSANDNWKFAADYSSVSELTGREWIVKVLEEKKFLSEANLNHWSTELMLHGYFKVFIDYNNLIREILPDPNVIYIDRFKTPKEELSLNGIDYSLNNILAVHDKYPALTGKGINVSVKENLMDTADIDFKGRYFHSGKTPSGYSTHSTIMATLIAGGGNSDKSAKGVAFGAKITNTTFGNLFPEEKTYYNHYKISIQNHSYGTAIENYYGAEAQLYDKIVNELPHFLPVFSAGNSGTLASAGPYKGLTGFANLTGDFKMSKNSLVVGATDAVGQLEVQSSRGPAYDGRVKPELVAFGSEGSSGAAALVSGAAALIQQAYFDKYQKLPPASVVKALLINGADDLGRPNVDFENGYGGLNLLNSLEAFEQGQFQESKVKQDNETTFIVEVPENTALFKITLCWRDLEGSLNTNKALMNDLDLEITKNETTKKWQPWVLSHYPSIDSLTALPKRKVDHLNNLEQITIDFPEAGLYTVSVKGHAVQEGEVAFCLAYQSILMNAFKWTFPTQNENLEAGTTNIVRWESTVKEKASLELSEDNGKTWKMMDENFSINQKFKSIDVDDVFEQGILRMKIDERFFYSDTFTISKPLQPEVVYYCSDSSFLRWPSVANVDKYQTFRLKDSFLEKSVVTADTSILIKNNSDLYFSVAPVIGKKIGVKSRGIDISTQGVGCFINSFTADLTGGESVQLRIELGDISVIKTLEIEKFSDGAFKRFRSFDDITENIFLEQDETPIEGINQYRARIILRNNREVLSEIAMVKYLDRHDFILFPNPISHEDALKILSKKPEPAIIEIYNTTGQILKRIEISDELESTLIAELTSGIYFYRISTEGGIRANGKILVND